MNRVAELYGREIDERCGVRLTPRRPVQDEIPSQGYKFYFDAPRGHVSTEYVLRSDVRE